MPTIFLLFLLSGCAAVGTPSPEHPSTSASHRSDERAGNKAKPQPIDNSVSTITINPAPQTVTVFPGQTKAK